MAETLREANVAESGKAMLAAEFDYSGFFPM
jgi:hypothetical protein